MAITSAQPITGPVAWIGADLARTMDWIWPITAPAAGELDAALAAVKRRGLAWPDIRREDFPIPAFARTLAEIRRELEDGRGVVLLWGCRWTDIPKTSCGSSTSASAPIWGRPGIRTPAAS